jgi:hypothetical protein
MWHNALATTRGSAEPYTRFHVMQTAVRCLQVCCRGGACAWDSQSTSTAQRSRPLATASIIKSHLVTSCLRTSNDLATTQCQCDSSQWASTEVPTPQGGNPGTRLGLFLKPSRGKAMDDQAAS